MTARAALSDIPGIITAIPLRAHHCRAHRHGVRRGRSPRCAVLPTLERPHDECDRHEKAAQENQNGSEIGVPGALIGWNLVFSTGSTPSPRVAYSRCTASLRRGRRRAAQAWRCTRCSGDAATSRRPAPCSRPATTSSPTPRPPTRPSEMAADLHRRTDVVDRDGGRDAADWQQGPGGRSVCRCRGVGGAAGHLFDQFHVSPDDGYPLGPGSVDRARWSTAASASA